MGQIFEIAIQIVMAYFQIVMMFFGVVFVAFAISILVSKLQQKTRKQRWIQGTVSAIREGESIPDENGAKRKIYYPVFEAVAANGQMVLYEYKARGFSIDKFRVGERMKILPLENQPGFVALEGDAKSDAFIVVFLLSAGAVLLGLPLAFIPITQMSFVVWAITAAFMAFKFKKSLKPKHLRETIAVFKARRAGEALTAHQHKQEISAAEINIKVEQQKRMGALAYKFSILIGFSILCAGGLGYNAQNNFIENAHLENVGPCGGELNTDCHRPIIFEDALSIMPLTMRPAMNGTYHSQYEPTKIMVDYGALTSLPYYILMALGILVIFSNVRRLSEVPQK